MAPLSHRPSGKRTYPPPARDAASIARAIALVLSVLPSPTAPYFVTEKVFHSAAAQSGASKITTTSDTPMRPLMPWILLARVRSAILKRLPLERIIVVGVAPAQLEHQRSQKIGRNEQRAPALALPNVDALVGARLRVTGGVPRDQDRKSTRLNSSH